MTTGTQKALEGRLQGHRDRALKRRKSRPCSVPGCGKQSIGSHLVQKALLARIAEKGKVWQTVPEERISPDPMKPWPPFREVGVGDALVFSGFCSSHDDELFREVETNLVPLDSARAAAVLAVKSMFHELWKVEAMLAYYEGVLGDEAAMRHPLTATWRPSFAELHSEYVERADLYKRNAEAWLREVQRGAVLAVEAEVIEDVGVCCSALFGFRSLSFTGVNPTSTNHVRFLNLLPVDGGTLFMVSGFEGTSVCRPFNLEGASPRRRAADMLVRWCESWVVSPSAYRAAYAARSDEIAAMRHVASARDRFAEAGRMTPFDIDLFDYALRR
jgi:hypothetical protein